MIVKIFNYSLTGIICFLTKYKLVKKPQKAHKKLLTIGKLIFSSGFIRKDIPKLIQKLEHSWQSNGFLTYGILAIKFLKGTAASVSDHPYETPKQAVRYIKKLI